MAAAGCGHTGRMAELQMRRARLADLPAVLGVLGQEWPDEAGQEGAGTGAAKWRARVLEAQASRDGHPAFDVLVLVDGGTVVAVAATELKSRRHRRRVDGLVCEVYLEYLAVHCCHRGRGYGRSLEEQLAVHWAGRGYRGAWLLVEPGRKDALDFWDKRPAWRRAPAQEQPSSRVLMARRIG